jgi:hypothetical protein
MPKFTSIQKTNTGPQRSSKNYDKTRKTQKQLSTWPFNKGSGQIYRFKRTAMQNMTVNNPVGGAIYYSNADQTTAGFNLGLIPGMSDFTNLFDQYRIVSVRMIWRPTATSNNVGDSADKQIPDLFSVEDANDGIVPTNSSSLLQYQTFRCERMDHEITRTIYPRTAVATYANGVVNGYSLQDEPVWVDIANPSVQHYGIKWALVWPANGTGAVTQYFHLQMDYHLEFRVVN